MIDILGPEGLEHLRVMARQPVLVALDFDGTLAPIVPRPEHAVMPETTRSGLANLAKRYPVILLTGRSRADGLRRLSGIPLLEVIGSHGLESEGVLVPRFLQVVAGWRSALTERLHAIHGVQLEDKRYSLSVHYRNAAEPGPARSAISAAICQLPGARIIEGKKVFNLLPEGAPDKGAALIAACRRQGFAHAIFVGDDDTDEAAFSIASQEEVMGIRVGLVAESKAPFYLSSQDRIDELLQHLISFRSERQHAAAQPLRR